MNNNSNNITSTASQFQSELNNWFQSALDKAIHIAICVIVLCVVVLVICVVVFCIVRLRKKKQIAQAQKEVNVVHGSSSNSNTIGLENVSKNKAKQMGFQQLQDVSNVPPQNEGGLNTQHKDNMSLSEIRIKNMQMNNNNNGGNSSISGDNSNEISNNNGNEGKAKKIKGGNKKGKKMNKGSSRISKMNINSGVNDNFEGHSYANTESGDKEGGAKKSNKNKMTKMLITEKDMEDELKKQMNKYQFS